MLLIFVSGKIVLTEGKKRGYISSFENIYPVLTEFKKLQLESDEADAGGGGLSAKALRRLGREEGNQKLLIKDMHKKELKKKTIRQLMY